MHCAIRWASVLVALVALAVIPACDRADAGKQGGITPTSDTRPAKKIKIGVSVPAAEHGWTAGISWWARRAMELYPDIEWTFATANNPEKQIADIEDMMVKGVQGLVILATESAPLTPVAKQAHQRGIFIVNVDRGFLEPVADIFLEGDNKAFGRTAARFMAQKLGGRGNIVILEGKPSTVNTDRVNAAMEVFADHPGITVLGRQAGEWNRRKSLEAMQAMLTRFPKIDAVWAADDDMALGARQAIEEAGRQREMWIFPGGGMKDVVKMVMDGDPMIPANVTYSPSMIAAGVHLAVSVLRDGKQERVMEFIPRHLMIDVELITPDNAQRYYFPDSIY
jgi:ribose transport system substrate-binding protein